MATEIRVELSKVSAKTPLCTLADVIIRCKEKDTTMRRLAEQAVLLDDNQVFYCKLAGLGTTCAVLSDLYYIKSRADPQTKETKSVLVKRGKELHRPDRMHIDARHIVLIEPVSPSSQIAKLIGQTKNE